jgi:hypothetical protein
METDSETPQVLYDEVSSEVFDKKIIWQVFDEIHACQFFFK